MLIVAGCVMRNLLNCSKALMIFGALVAFLSANGVKADGGQAPASTGQVADSKLTIPYGDWDYFLKKIVFDVGKPDRRRPERLVSKTATRISFEDRSISRFEANRIQYNLISDKALGQLKLFRKSLEQTASDPVFAQLRADERLAFWLNLHNVAVVELVAEAYPVRDAEAYMKKKARRKFMEINGELWSVNDIEDYVITRWQDQRVIYGFHRGYIGSPVLRPLSFTGQTVWDDLNDNADEFANSLRGIIFKDNVAYVSTFYQTVGIAFPSFEEDLRAFLPTVLKPELTGRLANTDKIKANQRNRLVADLYGGTEARPGQSSNTNPIALFTATDHDTAVFLYGLATKDPSNPRVPQRLLNLWKEVTERKIRQSEGGRVTVESVETIDAEEETEKEDKPD